MHAIINPELKSLKCPTQMTVWVPTDISIRRAIIKVYNAHSHPDPCPTKVKSDSVILVKELVASNGPVAGQTAYKVQRASSSNTLLGGKLLSDIDPALANPRKLQSLIKEIKKESYPAGEGWEGICRLQRQDNTLPTEERYIHTVRQDDDASIMVAMVPYLASFVHSARFLVCDFTFKRITGDIDEWEVVMWMDDLSKRACVLLVLGSLLTYLIIQGSPSHGSFATERPAKLTVEPV